jgi:hypothetical protein
MFQTGFVHGPKLPLLGEFNKMEWISNWRKVAPNAILEVQSKSEILSSQGGTARPADGAQPFASWLTVLTGRRRMRISTRLSGEDQLFGFEAGGKALGS